MPLFTSFERRVRRIATAVGVSALSLLSGCALLPAAQAPTVSPAPSPVTSVVPESASTPPPKPTNPGQPATPTPASAASPSTATTPPIAPGSDLATSFARFAAGQHGQLAVAVTAVGTSAAPRTFGQLGSPVAWSTSKVPVAIAVERTDRASELRSSMRQAITVSSNEAAETLWQSLGTPNQAAAATDRVLRDFGDPTTQTQSQRVRPPFTAFGQTRWSLADQARFGSSLPCRADAASVYAAMGQIVAEQRWGLGAIPGAHFKGGWGPAATGPGYLVRQLGVIQTSQGQVAVALAVEAASFQQGTVTLTQTARWLQTHADELPAGGC